MGGFVFGVAFVGVIWLIVEKRRAKKAEDQSSYQAERAPRPGEPGGGGC